MLKRPNKRPNKRATRISVILSCLSFVAIFLGCQSEVRTPSFLIITIDSLPFDSIHCSETDKAKGFKTICEEMVRFTHAYTPSLMAQSAIASLLTGKYPYEHGLWNNGSSYLSAKYITAPEIAYQKGYRTLFVSGGPPILRKSGLDQGFETFDDSFSLDYGHYYRPVMESFKVFLDWIKPRKTTPFFSMIFLSDLQFSEFPTVEDSGFTREATYDGQLKEIGESLETLFEDLKEKNDWSNTWIVVAGVNGTSRLGRDYEVRGTNLYHENTNIALFIKPPQAQEHQNFSWTVDAPVSLVDIGRTLFDLLESRFYDDPSDLFQTVSLKRSLLQAEDLPQDRIFLFESGWPQWRGLGSSVFALQKENYFLLYKKPPQIFNTLIDRNQIYPIVDTKKMAIPILTQTASQLLSLVSVDDRVPLSKEVIGKYHLASLFFKRNKLDSEILFEVQRFSAATRDKEVAGWLARYFVENGKWNELLNLGKEIGNSNWEWLASKNLDLKTSSQPSECLRLFENIIGSSGGASSSSHSCKDPLVLQFLRWLQDERKSSDVSSREIFLRNYRIFKIDLEIQALNLQNGAFWDTSLQTISRPQEIELILALNRMKKYKRTVELNF